MNVHTGVFLSAVRSGKHSQNALRQKGVAKISYTCTAGGVIINYPLSFINCSGEPSGHSKTVMFSWGSCKSESEMRGQVFQTRYVVSANILYTIALTRQLVFSGRLS